jgi:hypothetical protein
MHMAVDRGWLPIAVAALYRLGLLETQRAYYSAMDGSLGLGLSMAESVVMLLGLLEVDGSSFHVE